MPELQERGGVLNPMTFLPIVERELRLASRRGSTYWTRVVLGAIAIAVVGMTLAFPLISHSRLMLGGPVFYGLTLIVLSLCAFAGVFITADSLSEEKRDGTLGLLFLTDLKGYDVVLGKLIATSLASVSGLLTVFPVLGMILFMGGVSPGEFWRMILVVTNTLFFSLAAGLLVSSAGQNEHRSRGLTFGFIVLFGGGLPLVEAILGAMGVAGAGVLSVVSPLTAWRMAFDIPFRMGPHRYWGSLMATHLVSWGFIILASWILPRRWQERGRPPSARPREFNLSEGDISIRAAKRRRLLDANPVLWLATRRTGPVWVFSAICSLLLAVSIIALSVEPTIAVSGISVCAWGLSLCIRVSIGLQSSRFFSEARRSGTLELLLCAPLSGRQILHGHWLALRRYYLIPVIAVSALRVVTLVSVATMADSISFGGGAWVSPLMFYGAQAYPIVRFVADVAAVAWFGMLMGLTSRKAGQAAGLTILFAIILPGVAACIPNVIIDIPLILWARDKLRRELRSAHGRTRVNGGVVPPPRASPAPAFKQS